MKLGKETQEKIQQLQMMEQNLQAFLTQKQSFQTQLIEVESALKGLKNTKQAYQIVGNIMISSKKEELEKDLKEKKEQLSLRIKTLEKQEGKIKQKAQDLQKEILGEIKGEE